MDPDAATSTPPPSDEVVDQAVRAARLARDRAYVPYSGFAMGAAVVTDRGVTVPGALVENVSLGLALCAERAALAAAVATDAGRPAVLALVAPRTGGELTTPCGACRQWALELGGDDLTVVVEDPDGHRERWSLAQLTYRLPRRG